MSDENSSSTLPDPVSVETPATLGRARHPRRARLWVALGLCVVVVGAVVGLVATVGGPAPRPGTTASSRVPWTEEKVVDAALVDVPVLLPGTQFAYAMIGAPANARNRLVRIDLRSGRVTKGPSLWSASMIVAVDDSIAVISPTFQSDIGVPLGAWSLRYVVGHGVTLGAGHLLSFLGSHAPDSLSSVSVGRGPVLYLGEAKALFVVDARSGALKRTLRFPVTVASSASDANGRGLYVALNEVADGVATKYPTVIEDLDPNSGRVLASVKIANSSGYALLAGVDGGVWAAYRSTTFGTAELYRPSPPRLVAQIRLGTARDAAIPTSGAIETMGMDIDPIGDTMWLEAETGTSCVDPATGNFRSGHAFKSDHKNGYLNWTPFGTWRGRLYAARDVLTAPKAEVLAVTLPASCS